MACSRPQKEAGPNWLELPRDVTVNILQRLGTIEIVTSACLVCPLWWNICKEPIMWRTISMTVLGNMTYNMVKICRYAVERSSGHLQDIDIQSFCTNDLLKFIADRASKLQRMRLSYCVKISDEGLMEAAKKLSLLEELHISFCNNISNSKDSLEVIGQCCPLLKSLEFREMLWEGLKCDKDAFVIAKTMPNLRHLNIKGNTLTNVGLIAILDGCPLLESLDLRGCFQIDLSGDLGTRCSKQIKELLFDRTCSYNDYLKYVHDFSKQSVCLYSLKLHKKQKLVTKS